MSQISHSTVCQELCRGLHRALRRREKGFKITLKVWKASWRKQCFQLVENKGNKIWGRETSIFQGTGAGNSSVQLEHRTRDGTRDRRRQGYQKVKDMEFPPICKLISQLGTVLWMLADDARLLGQRQRTSLLMVQQAYHEHQHICIGFPSLNAPHG